MIKGSRILLMNALDYVRLSKFEFHLTGSRYFGTSHEESDWDFFIQESEDLIDDLRANGFSCCSETYAHDPIMTAVYGHENVHIQIVISATMKAWIQECLKPVFMITKPSKDQAKILWALGTKLYRNGMEADVYGVGQDWTKHFVVSC